MALRSIWFVFVAAVAAKCSSMYVCACVSVWPHNFLSLGSASCSICLWDANQNWLNWRGSSGGNFFSLLIALLIAILFLLPPLLPLVACGKCSALSIYGNVARFLLPIVSFKSQHNITSHSAAHNWSCTLTYIPHTHTHTHTTWTKHTQTYPFGLISRRCSSSRRQGERCQGCCAGVV